MKGKGNSINYKYRMHDPRIGRFFAVDPLCASYSWNSPYAFSENIVINAIEMEGMEKVYVYNVFWKNGVKHKKLSHTYIDKSLSVNQRKYRYFDGSGKVRNSVQQNITRSKSETTAAQTYLMNMAEFYEGFGDAIIDNVVSDAQTTLEYIRDPSQLGADLAQMGRLTAGNANKLIGLSDVNSGIDSKFGTEISQEVEAFWQSSVQKAAEMDNWTAYDWGYASGDVTYTTVGIALGAIGSPVGVLKVLKFAKISRLAVRTGKGIAAPMKFVEEVAHGTKLDDIIQKAKRLTYETGNEHALVKLPDGRRVLVSGNEVGINFKKGEIDLIYGHTHPSVVGGPAFNQPSTADYNILIHLDQSKQRVFVPGEGVHSIFNQGGFIDDLKEVTTPGLINQ